MTFRFVAGLAAFFVFSTIALPASDAHARSCGRPEDCLTTKFVQKNKGPHYVWNKTTRKWVQAGRSVRSGVAKVRFQQTRRSNRNAGPAVLPAARQQVVAMITQMAPSYGVPTWFALRIARIESGYNARARGRAGEYGVFQIKCATARGIGYRGNCSGLLNASINIRMGLKHLQLAVRSSRGNLRLAASKHNGGLGRKRLVRSYVNLVF
jgi:soluble lytic murein transglycosylase-like protein